MSVVSSIGYLAFLAGPPLIGFLGHEVGTLRALTAAAGLVSLGLLISGVLRPPAAHKGSDPSQSAARHRRPPAVARKPKGSDPLGCG